jgi:hypothetical protein
MLNKLARVLLLPLVFGASPARADSQYEIIGTLTMPGNVPGVGETINYSFEVDYSLNSNTFNGHSTFTLIGTPTVTSFGPFGTFTIGGGTGNVIGGTPEGYVPFYNTSPTGNRQYSVEIDLNSQFFRTLDTSSSFDADIWGCYDQTLCKEFYPGNGIGGPNGPYAGGLYWPGTATAAIYPVSAPEPGTLGLFVLGILALFLGRKLLRARRVPHKRNWQALAQLVGVSQA